MSSKINVLQKKVESIEKKLNLNNDEVPGWAMKAAEWEGSKERMYAPFNKLMGYEKPMKYQTEEQIIAFAKEISEKYTCYEEFHKNYYDYTKLDKLLNYTPEKQINDDKQQG